jgi:hypothetical protein
LARGAFANNSNYTDGFERAKTIISIHHGVLEFEQDTFVSSDLDIVKRTLVALQEIGNVTSLLEFKHDMKNIGKVHLKHLEDKKHEFKE